MKIRISVLLLVFFLLYACASIAGSDDAGKDAVREEAAALSETFAEKRKVEAESMTIDDYFARALAYYEAGDLQKAKELFEKVLEMDPAHSEAADYLKTCRDRTPEAEPRSIVEKHYPGEEAVEKGKRVSEEEEEAAKLAAQAKEYFKKGYYRRARMTAREVLLVAVPGDKYYRQAQKIIEKSQWAELKKEKADIAFRGEVEHEKAMLQIDKKWIVPEREKIRKEIEAPKETEMLAVQAAVEKKLEGQITLDLNQVHLREMVNMLNESYGLNLVLDERIFLDEAEHFLTTGVSPLVSVYLKDISLGEALEVILRTKRMKYRVEKNLVWITSRRNLLTEEPMTRIFQLSTKRDEIEDIIRSSIPEWPEDQTSLKYDSNSNTLVITHVPAYIELARDIIRRLDIIPIQISIQAKFVEIEETALRELGMALSDLSEYGFFIGDEKDGKINIDSSFFDSTAGAAEDWIVTGDRGTRIDYWRLKDTAFHAVLEALDESGQSKLLSSPQVTTMNNSQAVIRVVKPMRYPTRYRIRQNTVEEFSPASGRTSSLRHDRVTPTGFKKKDVGITLTVTPSVGADRRTITLTLIPEIVEHVDWIEFLNVTVGTADAGGVWLVKTPKFYTRTVVTSVLVDDGETIILGGLLKESEEITTEKVPFLGDIPLLGTLFRKDKTIITKSNLLIFVTSHILTPSGDRYINTR